MRFKATKGYSRVEKSTYEQYLENEYGVFIPYNALGLFLASVGDTADDIKGINKFGKVAFKKLITKISCTHNIDWSQCGDYNKLEEVIKYCKEVLTDEEAEAVEDQQDTEETTCEEADKDTVKEEEDSQETEQPETEEASQEEAAEAEEETQEGGILKNFKKKDKKLEALENQKKERWIDVYNYIIDYFGIGKDIMELNE